MLTVKPGKFDPLLFMDNVLTQHWGTNSGMDKVQELWIARLPASPAPQLAQVQSRVF